MVERRTGNGATICGELASLSYLNESIKIVFGIHEFSQCRRRVKG